MNEKNKRKNTIFKIISAIIILSIAFSVAFFGFSSLLKTLYPMKYTNTVDKITEQYNLSKFFVYAVIKCESNFDTNAVSSTGARGLMQIMPDTFDWISSKLGKDESFENAFSYEISIEYGCYFYSYLLEKYENEAVAVAAYHAGMTNVDKWLKDKDYSLDGKTLYDIPFPTTKKYVDKVLKTKNIYQNLYG